MTVYTVKPSTPTTTVAFNDCQKKGYTPSQLYSGPSWFLNVPIPPGAQQASGTDGEMTIYEPATDQLWEFWVASRSSTGQWSACWGGRLDKASQSSGFFANGGGALATGLVGIAGEVTLSDVRQGHIDHAVEINLPDVRAYPALSWPAQRTDGGSSDSSTPQEGRRFRLDPTIDVNSLGLTPIATMIAKAAQTYGFVVSDQAGAVAIIAQSGIPEQAQTGVDPWKQLLNGVPTYNVMADFPWSRLIALPTDYGKP